MAWPPRFLFISGRLALDFVHTGGEGARARWERWGSTADLADWMRACPLLRVKARVEARDLGEARQLREAIWSGAQAILAGRRPASEILCRIAARPALVPTLRRGERAWAPGSTGR
jgi:Putative stress-induced transcription regulator